MTTTAPGTPQQPSARRLRTQERLIDAAVSVFARRGVIGASVEEICEAADFTRGAFYSNFRGKDEIVLALIRRECDDALAGARDAVAQVADAEPNPSTDPASWRAILEMFAGRLATTPDRLLALQEIRLYAARVPELADEVLVLQEQTRLQFREIIRAAVGLRRRRLTASEDTVISVLIGLYDNITLTALLAQAQAQAGGQTGRAQLDAPLDFALIGEALEAMSEETA